MEAWHPAFVAGLFAASAVVVWMAGSRVARYADVIAERTGAGRAFLGVLLLGGLTSLPELATTVTASLRGNAPLAVNNLFGGVAMQVTILAAMDLIVRGRALTGLIRGRAVTAQALLSAFLAALALAGILAGEVTLGRVGIWATAIAVATVGGLYLAHRLERPAGEDDAGAAQDGDGDVQVPEGPQRRAREQDEAVAKAGGAALVVRTAIGGLAILGAGILLARSGEALAVQTGLGSSFVGAVLVAVATSLPEISTTFGAILLGNYAMAFSNVFGANAFDVGILFVADLAFPQGALLDRLGAFSAVAALLAIVLTLVYVGGILLRARSILGRVGVDSALVLVLYLAGLTFLYTLRGAETAERRRRRGRAGGRGDVLDPPLVGAHGGRASGSGARRARASRERSASGAHPHARPASGPGAVVGSRSARRSDLQEALVRR